MKIINIVLIILLVSTVNSVSAEIIVVDSHHSNTNNTFFSIQDAIDHSQENDSIVLISGTYFESLVIDHPIDLYSLTLDPSDVIITDNSSSFVIHILSDNVKITGMTITGQNDTYPATGILIDSADNSQIQDNVITNTQNGIYIEQSSGALIQNNTVISNTEHGIYLLDSRMNKLEGNNIQNNKRGIYFDSSDKNTLTRNYIKNNQNYGLALRKSSLNSISQNQLDLNNIGLALTSANKNIITENNANENEQYGLFLWESVSNTINSNTFTENGNSGIYLLSPSKDNKIKNNLFLRNQKNGITIDSTDNNTITDNEFTSNGEYGIYHLYPNDKNVIKNNFFSKNLSENIKLSIIQEVAMVIIALILVTLIAFCFKLAWLKKGLAVLVALLLLLIAINVIWYFPFESGLLDYNVHVQNIETNIIPVNETHSRVSLSMNLDYLNKYSSPETNDEIYNDLPVFVQISSKSPADGDNSNYERLPESNEQVVLKYSQSNQYGCTFDLEKGKTYDILIEVQLKQELPYPHPYYGETKWKLMGENSTEIHIE